MSIEYIYNKYNTKEAILKVLPDYDLDKFFADIKGKENDNKNMFALVLMFTPKKELYKLLDSYVLKVMDYDGKGTQFKTLFSNADQTIINTVRETYVAVRDKNLCLLELIITQVRAMFQVDNSDVYRVFEQGRDKYSPWSFMNLDPILLVPAIGRHLYKHFYISKIDNESGRPHAAHVLCNLIMLYHIIKQEKENANN